MESHFYGMPVRRDFGISKFKPHPARTLTTFNAGYLVPLWLKEMLPGDTRTVKPSFIVRSQTPIRPVLDDAVLDLYCFFVPNRLVQDHWVRVMGENQTSYWVNSQSYSVPHITSPSGGFLQYSTADYLFYPTKVTGLKCNALPLRGYCLIWNEWFRDQNLQSPAVCPKDDASVIGVTSFSDPILYAYRGDSLLPVCRVPDYFSTCTPGPLKASSVVTLSLPDVPVLDVDPATGSITDPTVSQPRIYYANGSDAEPVDGEFLGTDSASGGSEPSGRLVSKNAVGSGASAAYVSLAAKTSTVGISINDLRFAVQLQKLLERDLFGTRYCSILEAHFNVKAQDSRLQRPELHGWRRYRLNQQQVVQSSETGTTPQGNVAAYSLTVGAGDSWTVSAPEHGFLFVVGCIRVSNHVYQQGLDAMFSRFNRYDYYWNEFQSLGNQAVPAQQIYAAAPDGQTFGYQEYAADYRYNISHCTGEMRSNATGSLETWHYADKYNSTPTLSAAWIADNSKDLIDRSLSVKSNVANQFFGCFDFGGTLTTEVPMYSIPGYVDHY